MTYTDSKLKRMLDEARAARQEMMAPAAEILEHVSRFVLAIWEFKLMDGTVVRIEPFIAPAVNEKGEAHFGFDAIVGDRGHLEFTIAATGWGKRLAERLVGPAITRTR